MSIGPITATGESEIRARVELTETHLITRYYSVCEGDLPDNWSKLSPDEQAIFLKINSRHIRDNVDEIQERTDGVYLTWDKSHPQWTVTFTYTNTEVVSAPNREAAIEVARDAIAQTYGKDNRDGAARVLRNADVDVENGNYGI